MKKFTSWVKSIFANPAKDYNNISKTIDSLIKEMERIKKMPNKVEAIIELFKVISPLQDAGGFSQTIFKLQEKNYGQLDETITALESLQKHIVNAGRSEYGMNRTKPGEAVTAANVYLGDVFGIWTKPATYWLENQQRFENDDSGVSPKPESGRKFISTWYCINDYQAGEFVQSHVNGIIEQIDLLKKSFA